MKNFLCSLPLFFFCYFAAQPTPSLQQIRQQEDSYWQNAVSVISQNISPQNNLPYLSTGINYSRSSGFANLYQFNNANYNTADYKLFLQALGDLYLGSGRTQFVNPDDLKPNFQNTARVAVERSFGTTIQLGIINTHFDFLYYDEENESSGGLHLANGVFQPIAGKPSAFTRHVTLVSPLQEIIELTGGATYFRINPNLFFEKGKKIKNLVADFGNGQVSLISNGNIINAPISATFTSSGDKVFTFRITYDDNTVLTTFSKIHLVVRNNIAPIRAAGNCTSKTDVIQYTSTIPYKAWTESVQRFGELEYKIFYANNNQSGVCGIDRIKRPFIVIDGFDPTDKRKIEKTDCDDYCQYLNRDADGIFRFENYKGINELMTYKVPGNSTPISISDSLQKKGYDVVIINLPTKWRTISLPFNMSAKVIEHDYGADFIERNAMSFASLLKDINASMRNRGITEKAVVVGPSMGGQITRYGLAYMEKKQQETGDSSWDHNTRLWVSMDSPHQGANIPLTLQGSTYFLGHIRGIESAKKNYNEKLMSPAARQMLIEHNEEIFRQWACHHHLILHTISKI